MTTQEAPGGRAPRPLLFALFFLSGASGLVFEILWIRALGIQFGTTAPALAAVLAAFMAGLALGNLLIGPLADRHPRPLALYGRLEAGIAVSALAVTLLLLRGDAALAVVAGLVDVAGPAGAPLRFCLFCLLLLIPTTLMGGTLPVLSRALAPGGQRGRVVGALYAINTAGAVAGALAPDLLLVPVVGLTGAAGAAALGNLAVAWGVGRLARGDLVVPPAAPVKRSPVPRLPLLLFAVSGFCAMGLEVLWSRTIQHWAWGDVASFSVLLAVYLLFVAVGAAAAAPWADRARRPVAWAAGLLVAAGIAVVFGLVVADRVHRGVAELLPFAGLVRPGPIAALARAGLLSAWLEAPACLLMGAAFPFLAAAAVEGGQVGRRTGLLYAVNTLAGVAGSVATCFVLMPALGVQTSLLVLALAMTVTGAAALVAVSGSPLRIALTVLTTAGLALGALLLPADHLRHTYFDVAPEAMVELREGPTTTAAVIRGVGADLLPFQALLTPGVYMSSTSFAAQRYMSLMAQVPLLFSTERSEALLICFGAGNTARALLASPGLERLDVVDISPEVIGMSHLFADTHGGDPLDDPRAFTHIDDGRQHLLTTDQRYDVITLEPPPPTHAGVVNLYSREYYASARGRLKEGGVVAQWLPVFQLAPRETLAIIAALVAEFPHTALFQGIGHQWFLLGSSTPLLVDIAGWDAHLAQPEVALEMARIGMSPGPAGVLATFMVGDAVLREAAAHGREVTDDFPSLQYPRGALSVLVEYPALLTARPEGALALVPGGWEGLGGVLQQEAARSAFAVQEVMFAALRYETIGPPAERELVYGTMIREALRDDLGTYVLEQLGVGPGSVAEAERRLALAPDPAASLLMARSGFYGDRWQQVLVHLADVVPGEVGEAHYWLLRGGAERGLGRSVEAVASFGRAQEAGMSLSSLRRMDALRAATALGGQSPGGPLSVSEAGGPPDAI